MKEDLERSLVLFCMENGVPADIAKNGIFRILCGYTVSKETTEVALCSADVVNMYISKFLMSKRLAGRTDRTLKKYAGTLNMFFAYINKSPLDIMLDDIRLFLAQKQFNDGASPAYIVSMTRDLSSFFTWMTDEEYIAVNPVRRLEAAKIPKVQRRAFTEKDIEMIRRSCDISRCDRTNRTMATMVEVLLSTGCRISEAVNIKIADIEKDGKVKVLGKGQKERFVYLNARAQLVIEEYIAARKDKNEYLFPKGRTGNVVNGHMDAGTVEGYFRRISEKTGIKDVHPHRFRRTCATMSLQRGMPIEYVSKMLGHADISTTQIYLDLNDKDLQRFHEKFVV